MYKFIYTLCFSNKIENRDEETEKAKGIIQDSQKRRNNSVYVSLYAESTMSLLFFLFVCWFVCWLVGW